MIWIRGRLERHGRLVVCGSSADTDGDPAVRQGDNRELTLEHRLAAEHLSVEAPGALDVPGDDEVVSAIPSVGAGNCAICLLLPSYVAYFAVSQPIASWRFTSHFVGKMAGPSTASFPACGDPAGMMNANLRTPAAP